MRKKMRRIGLLLCCVMLCLALCSCQYLDDSKANTAAYTDDSMDSLTFRGKLYKSIETPYGMSFIMSEVHSDRYVTLPDVPVLLSSSFGDQMDYDAADEAKGEDTPIIFNVYRTYSRFDSRLEAMLAGDLTDYVPEWADDGAIAHYYVREDAYDRIAEAIDTAEMDHYYTLVYRYEDSTTPWTGGMYLPALLDEDVTEVIHRTLTGGEAAAWKDIPNTEWYSIYLMECDQSMLLTENNRYLMLLTDGSDYYLCLSSSMNQLYHVSDDDFSVIRKVYSLCENSLQVADISYFREFAGQ